MLLDRGENLIALGAGFLNVTGLKGETKAFSRRIRLVNRYMAPPNASVVPEVVIGVVIINTKGDFSLGFHLCDSGGVTYAVYVSICFSIEPST